MAASAPPDGENAGSVSAATEICSEYVSVSPSVSSTVQLIPHWPDELGFPRTDESVTVKPAHVPLTEYDNGALPPAASGREKRKSCPTMAASAPPDGENAGSVSAATEICSEYVSVSPSASSTVHVIPHWPTELGGPLTEETVTVKPAHEPLTEYVNEPLPSSASGRLKLKSCPTMASFEIADGSNIGDVSSSSSSNVTVAWRVVPTTTTPEGRLPNDSDTVSSALSASSLAVIVNDCDDAPEANDNHTVPFVRPATA